VPSTGSARSQTVYTTLEDAPADGVPGGPTGGDRFVTAPYQPPGVENRDNQWLTRFGRTREGTNGDDGTRD